MRSGISTATTGRTSWPGQAIGRGSYPRFPKARTTSGTLPRNRIAGAKPLFGWRTKFWSFLLKLAKEQPSWTIQAVPGPATGPFHWRSRLLSTRELVRLQTFPDDYPISGDRRAAQRQIGNAVPCALVNSSGWRSGETFSGRRFGARCDSYRRAETTVRLRSAGAQWRASIALAGDHAEHPGASLGPGVTRVRMTGLSLS